MNSLALQVASQHCLQSPGAASPSTDGHQPATVRSVATPAPAAHSPPPPSTDPNQPTSPPPSDRCQPVALRSVADVKSAIFHLKKTFSKLVSRTRSEMCARESQEQEFLDEFRDHLLLLPVSKKAAHVKFFRENEDDILEARNIRKLFAILSRYLTFRNYEILQEIITWFDVAPLQQSMQEYCGMLMKFEMLTPVDVYIGAVPEETDEAMKSAFSQMVLRIEKPASECTLYDLRKLSESIITNSGLSSHSVYLGGVANKCVEVVVRFPPIVVGWVLAALTPHFMTTHHLSEVTVDGSQLTLLPDHRHMNDELIRAVEEGDLMMVASLLNSGADIQTLNRYLETPLDQASYYGHLQVVRLLTGRGSEVECRDRSGLTPLISA
ncbi:Serine/threonine-protein phosphatase 6 regulatory ankyrin repeat subunit C, partial [Geodia barretti]